MTRSSTAAIQRRAEMAAAQIHARAKARAAEVRAEAQDEGAAGEREAVARIADPALWSQGREPWNDPTWKMVSWSEEDRQQHAEDIEASLAKADRILARAHPSPTPAADADRVRIAVEALEPFSQLGTPKKPVGARSGLYSIFYRDIRRASEAIAALKSEGK